MTFNDFIQQLRMKGLESFGKYYGVYRGFITSNEDPENRGRVQLRVPQVFGEPLNYWALPVGQYAGKNKGMYFIPDVGDPVWVQFEAGNLRFPVWEYGWRMERLDNAEPGIKLLQTATGHRIELNDTDGHLRITDASGKVVELNAEGISLGSPKASAEPAVLGNKNAELHDAHLGQLEALMDTLIQFTATQSAAAGTVPFTVALVPGYTALSAGLVAAKALVEAIRSTQVAATKSNQVTLD